MLTVEERANLNYRIQVDDIWQKVSECLRSGSDVTLSANEATMLLNSLEMLRIENTKLKNDATEYQARIEGFKFAVNKLLG